MIPVKMPSTATWHPEPAGLRPGSGVPLDVALSTRQGDREYQQDVAGWQWTESGLLIAALCDGLGSLPGSGEVARIACDYILAIAALPFAGAGRRAVATLRAASALTRAHPESQDGDTTAVVVVLDPVTGTVDGGYVGDTRLYVFDDDSVLHLKSADHNLAHQGNPSCLTRSLVGAGHDCSREPCTEHEPDRAWWPGAGGSRSGRVWRVILTTDGVHDVLTHVEMEKIVTGSLDVSQTATRLTAIALSKAGREARARKAGREADNATALVVEFPPWPAIPVDHQ